MSVSGEIKAIVKAEADQASINNATQQLMKLKTGLTKMLGAIGIGISLVQLNAIAEEFNGINDQINNAVGNAANMKEVQRDILDAANNCRVSYGQMASSVVALKQANSEVFPLEDATKFVETVNMLGKVAGYDNGQIATMNSSLQRMAITGTMGATDIMRISRNAPELLKAISKGLQVSEDELDEMAAKGELTAEKVKEAVLNSQDDIKKGFDQLDYSISDGLLHIRNRWGYWVDDMNSTFHISETIAKIMVTAFEKVMTVLEKGKKKLEEFAKFLGGTENLLKVLAFAAGAFLVVMNWDKIIKGATMFMSLLRKIPGLFSAANLKVLGLIAIVALLALVIDDFINFMQGNESVIGYCFEKAGIDAEEMRQKIINIWENLKQIFGGIFDGMLQAADIFADGIMDIFRSIFGEDLFAGAGEGLAGFIEVLERLTGKLAENRELLQNIGMVIGGVIGAFLLFKTVVTVFMTLTAVLGPVASVIGAVLGVIAGLNPIVLAVIAVIAALAAVGAYLYKNWDTVKVKAAEIWNNITSTIRGAVDSARATITGVWNAITGFISGVLNGIAAFFVGVWNTITSVVTSAMETIRSIINGILNAVMGIFTAIWNGIVGYFTGIWQILTGNVSGGLSTIFSAVSSTLSAVFGIFQSIFGNIVSAVSSRMAEVSSSIIGGFQSAVSFIQGLIGQAFAWGSDLIGNIANGIRSGIGAVVDAASSVAGAIKGALGHSVPKEGPLVDELNWMPDMMQNLATGIDRNRFRIKNAINRVAGDMSIVASANMVRGATAGAVSNSITNKRSVNQNVEITNQFYGDRAIQQKASNAMNRSAQDVTSQLARGLAYAR